MKSSYVFCQILFRKGIEGFPVRQTMAPSFTRDPISFQRFIIHIGIFRQTQQGIVVGIIHPEFSILHYNPVPENIEITAIQLVSKRQCGRLIIHKKLRKLVAEVIKHIRRCSSLF